jgi:hypothetical protein
VALIDILAYAYAYHLYIFMYVHMVYPIFCALRDADGIGNIEL